MWIYRSKVGDRREGPTGIRGHARRFALVAALSLVFMVAVAGAAGAVSMTSTTLPPIYPPSISSISPSVGPVAGGNTVTITGSNFNLVSKVTFGTVTASVVTPVSSTSLQVTVPASVTGSGSVTVAVTAAGGTSSPGDFSGYYYMSPPAIEALEVTSGPTTGGTSVIIYGTNFYNVTGVTFGGVPALSFTPVQESEGTRIIAVAPAHVAGIFSVQVTTAGGASADTSGDDFTFIGGEGTRYEQSDGRFWFSPAWYTSAYSQYSGGSEKYTYGGGASVYIPFRGTRLDWITKTSKAMGIASVSVDGGPAVKVDLYSETTLYQQKVWSTGVLSQGLHVVKITRTGTRNPSSSGTALSIDAVNVDGTLVWPTRYQENNAAVGLSGSWATTWSWSFSGGKMKTANAKGCTMTVPFEGVKLNLVATKGRRYGKVSVSVDGGPATIVDLYSYPIKYKQTVYSTGFLAPGPHTVTIKWTGSKNPYSKGYSINVDSFDITGAIGEDS